MNTETLAGQIAVMQAALDGEQIQIRHIGSQEWNDVSTCVFNWVNNDYQVKPNCPVIIGSIWLNISNQTNYQLIWTMTELILVNQDNFNIWSVVSNIQPTGTWDGTLKLKITYEEFLKVTDRPDGTFVLVSSPK
jgi:hypothetical protein